MAIDPHSVLGQAQNANSLLAAYFSAMNKFAADVTGSTPLPDVTDVTNGLDYSELLRMAMSRTADSASYENGAAIENISHIVAIEREYSMRIKGKVNFYSDAATDFMSDSNFYSTRMVYWVNMLSGIYSETATN